MNQGCQPDGFSKHRGRGRGEHERMAETQQADAAAKEYSWTRANIIVLVVLCLAPLLEYIDMTVVNVALPTGPSVQQHDRWPAAHPVVRPVPPGSRTAAGPAPCRRQR